MDVEIVKQNGQSFRLSDYGVVQDFVVHSIDRTVVRDPIEGRAGSADYGVEIGDRTIEVPMIFKAADLHDYAHLRDELYGLLDDSEPFYIREMRRPKALQYDFVDFGQKPKWEAQTDNEYVNGKQYKVRLNSTLTPEQRSLSGEVNIEFVTSGNPYAETIYTTLELHDSGYSATAEKYGLVDNIDDEKVQYRFTPGEDEINFNSSSFQNGNIHNSGGHNLDTAPEYARTDGFLPVIKNSQYRIVLEETSGNAEYVRLFHFNSDGSFISNDAGMSNVGGNGKSEYNFTALGENLRLVVYPVSGKAVSLSDIGGSTKISMYTPSTLNTFSVYNAGNVTIEPESMDLFIAISYATSNGDLTLKNLSTGDEFRLSKDITNRNIILDGMNVRDGTTNAFRHTNRRFITLAPGDNEFEISGATFNEIRFRFKYLYK